MPFVLDASVAAGWAFDDETLPLPRIALDRLEHDRALVPALWWFEILNILAVNERRGRLSPATTAKFLQLVRKLGIEIDRTPNEMAILSLARRHCLTAYEAAYLELSLRLNLPLATLDRDLADAALRDGVALLTT